MSRRMRAAERDACGLVLAKDEGVVASVVAGMELSELVELVPALVLMVRGAADLPRNVTVEGWCHSMLEADDAKAVVYRAAAEAAAADAAAEREEDEELGGGFLD